MEPAEAPEPEAVEATVTDGEHAEGAATEGETQGSAGTAGTPGTPTA
jgi:hypothetical protein